MKKWLLLVLAAFMLSACSDKEEVKTESIAEDSKEVGSVGFEVLGDEIEEAENIPEQEQESILSAFDEYIAAFNAKDIDRYIETLSKNPQGFEYDDDIEMAKNAFAQYNIERKASDKTIVKYNENEAQVFANLDIEMTEIETNAELSSSGRQVTVFVKEEGAWKVTSVYYIGDESQE